ncbi:MAG TPA: hypothetical protein VL992_20585, partial [Tepidisphaeraceae bacterium]|nr:hypothetical protein [Tepidisphaeraceae bacterium]
LGHFRLHGDSHLLGQRGTVNDRSGHRVGIISGIYRRACAIGEAYNFVFDADRYSELSSIRTADGRNVAQPC